MIKHIWSVLCQQSIVNRDSNNISLIEVIEQLSIEGRVIESESEKPKLLPLSFNIVSMWIRENLDEPADSKANVIFLSPRDKELSRKEVHIDLSEYQRFRTISRINGLPFSGYGQYKFVIKVLNEGDWKTVATLPLSILAIKKSKDSKD